MAVSMTDFSSLVASGVAVATALAGGIGALWARLETQNRKIKERLDECRDDRAKSRERRSLLVIVLGFVTDALERCEPKAPEIAQSRAMLAKIEADDRIDLEMAARSGGKQ